MEQGLHPDTDYTVQCDNQATTAAFNKTRSKNAVMHEMVTRTVKNLAKVNSRLSVKWISTAEMTKFADGPSRGRYNRDDFGLSEVGWREVCRIAPEIEKRKEEGDLVSLFAGPRNNPAGVPYYCLDRDLDDPLSRKRDAFEALEIRKKAGRAINGGVLAYPPLNLISTFNKEVRSMGLGQDCCMAYILPAAKVRETLNALWGVGEIKILQLCGARNGTVLHKKINKKLVLLLIQSREIVNQRLKRRR